MGDKKEGHRAALLLECPAGSRDEHLYDTDKVAAEIRHGHPAIIKNIPKNAIFLRSRKVRQTNKHISSWSNAGTPVT